MTIYELSNFCNSVYQKIEELNSYTLELIKLISEVKKFEKDMLEIIYTYGFSNNNYISKANTIRDNIINYMQQFTMDFNTLENHRKLIQIKDEIYNMFDKSDLVLVDEKERVSKLIDDYFQITSMIYGYVKTRNNSDLVNLLNQSLAVVNDYNKLAERYKSILEFVQKTETKFEESDMEKIIKLQFSEDIIELRDFILRLESINKCYESFCQLSEFPINEYQLKVIKIESGSLFEKFFGSEKIIEALAFIIKRTAKLLFSKFTFEGKIVRHKQILDLMKEDAEVIKKYKELGINFDLGKEEIIKNHYVIVKSISKMLGNSTKVKIDDDEIKLEDQFRQKYLLETAKLLETNNDDEQQKLGIKEEEK